MSEQIERVGLQGATVEVTARPPLPVEPRILARLAAARVFERYPVLDCLVLAVDEEETRVPREEIIGLLGPEGFAVLRDPVRYRQWLIDVLHGPASEAPP